jgi:beta-galactosidase
MTMSNSIPALAVLLMSSLPGFAGEWISLDDSWRFHLGEPAAQSAAAQPGFDDSRWSQVMLPHDWSIGLAPDSKAPGEGNVGFFPTGSAWYRHSFKAHDSWKNRRVSLRFDGVYMNASVWVNGKLLGTHPYGYTPFDFDLSPLLVFGAENTIAVHVDNSAQSNTRWYSGSGIYRHVRLHVTEPVHIPIDGLRVATLTLDKAAARLRVLTEVSNDSPSAATADLLIEVLSPSGKVVSSLTESLSLSPGEKREVLRPLAVDNPQPWSPDEPRLYRLRARLVCGDGREDRTETAFGLRTVSVSAERGFLLNGQPVKLLGGNVHHDNGALGAASFDRAEERKVILLKQAGFNAVRTSHNPPAPAFLDACDRLGLLVLDEAFDGWVARKNSCDYGVYFKDWWQRDLDAMLRRDFNHPSVVLWSIGNETYERGSVSGRDIAAALSKRIRSIDTSRPVAIGLNGLPEGWQALDGLFAHLDVAGYNYEFKRHADDHVRIPGRVMVSTESYQSEAFANWKIFSSVPYAIGDFVWSAIDYLGESGIGRVYPPGVEATPHWKGNMWPWHGATCGDIDLSGWRKPASHYRQIVWDRGEKLYAAVRLPSPDGREWSLSQWSMPPSQPSWTWPGYEGKTLTLEVFSRYDSVRVRLNGRPLGDYPAGLEHEFKVLIPVPYEAGTLVVTGLSGAKEVESFTLVSAGPASGIRLRPEQKMLRADGQDLLYCVAELVDERGTLVPTAQSMLTFSASGPVQIMGCASGDLSDNSVYAAPTRKAHQGRLLVILRSQKSPGHAVLNASAPGLKSAALDFEVTQP